MAMESEYSTKRFYKNIGTHENIYCYKSMFDNKRCTLITVF